MIPPIKEVEPGTTWYGVFVLILGWFAALGNPERHEYWSIAWFANPLFFLSLAWVLKRKGAALIISLVALPLALTSLSVGRIWNDKEPPTVIVSGYGFGYYLWVLAFVFLVVAAWRSRLDVGR